MFYSTGVTNELVRTLGLSDKTPPGLPGLKPSSNSVLPVAWITRPATDIRLQKFFICFKRGTISSCNRLMIYNFSQILTTTNVNVNSLNINVYNFSMILSTQPPRILTLFVNKSKGCRAKHTAMPDEYGTLSK